MKSSVLFMQTVPNFGGIKNGFSVFKSKLKEYDRPCVPPAWNALGGDQT